MFAAARHPSEVASWLEDAGSRSKAMVLDLPEEQWTMPYSPFVTPFLWELGHVTWFHERFVLREALGLAPLDKGIDDLYDSSTVPHAARWDLEAFDLGRILDWDAAVRARETEALASGDERVAPLVALAVFHEDMHAEAFAWTRQALGLARPEPTAELPRADAAGLRSDTASGDVHFEPSVVRVGSLFGFDTEALPHEVELEAFALAKHCVDEAQFRAFVEDGGYRRDEFWCAAGKVFREQRALEAPLYWRREDGDWRVRDFDRWRAIEARRPMLHVSWYEASAWCRWARRRLPTEHEWERACKGLEGRRFPWGDEVDGRRAQTGFATKGDEALLAAPDELADGRSEHGLAHLIGNVWEWTASVFEPYVGFEAGCYANYSRPFFGKRRVLRGGSWATTQRMLSSSMRNFFEPERCDVFAGFRTCALEGAG